MVCDGRFFLGGGIAEEEERGGAKEPTGGMLRELLLVMGAPLVGAALVSGRNCLKSSKRSGAPSKSLVTCE